MTTIELVIPNTMTKEEIDSLAVGILRMGYEVYLNVEDSVLGFKVLNSDIVYKDDK